MTGRVLVIAMVSMLPVLLAAALHSVQGAFAGPPACFASLQRRAVGTIVLEAPDAEPAPLQSYNDAEKRGMELFQAGEHERAIRMFELAQVCPRCERDATHSKIINAPAHAPRVV